MSGGIILGICAVFAVICLFAFIAGYRKARGKAEKERLAEDLQKAQDAVFYEKEKVKMKEEVFGNAEEKKADLNRGGSSRDRFDRINDVLCGFGKDAS